MMRLDLSSLRAAIEIAVWRHGWWWTAAGLALAVSVAAELALTATQAAELMRLRSNLGKAAASAPAVPASDALSASAMQAERIEAQLQAQDSFESQMRRVVDIAAKHDIVLKRGEYVTAANAAGGAERIQVGLGVSARYPQFREFVEDVLRQCPAVSLDRFSLKRDKVEQGQAEIQITLSFWHAGTSKPRAAPVTVAVSKRP
jgi:hypothetical protein